MTGIPKHFWYSWLGLAALFLLLQFLLNDAYGPFAVATSLLGALPGAIIITVRGDRRRRQQR